MKVLFIAKNIPRPGKQGNKIIITIAEKLSVFCDISVLRPREKVPFWLKRHPKYSDLVGLKVWETGNFKITTYPYINIPLRKARYWLLFCLSPFGKKYIENNKFHLTHAHYLFPDGLLAYKIFKKYKIPFVITFRSHDKQYLELISKNNPDYLKAKKILWAARQILVTNGGYKAFIESKFGMTCDIMPHGIEAEVFDNKGKQQKQDEINILSVADTLSTKNVDWVINAFKAYGGEKKTKLRLIGDVCTRKDIIELSANDKRIELLGKLPREEVLQHMKESDIFALPSSKETFGLVYLEAAAKRNAIIGFKGEGVWGVFEEDKELLFCENYPLFETQMHNLIENSSRRTELAQHALEKAKQMTWENIQMQYKDVYLKALGQ